MLQQHVDALTRGSVITRVFVLHWAQAKSKDIQYANKLITLPGREQIGERDVPEYPDGSPIPGAVLVVDEHGEDDDGNSRMFFDALKAVHYFLGIQPKKDAKGKVMNGDPRSALYRAGLSALPFPCTPEEIGATLTLAKERVDAFDYETSLRVIGEHDQKNAARTAHGQEAISGGKAYNDAVLFKRDYEARQALKVGLVATLQEANPGVEEDELEFMAFARLKVMKLAEKAVPESTDAQRAQLVNEWLENKDIRARLTRDFKLTFRRKGYSESASFEDKTLTAPADDSVLNDGAPVPS